MERAAIKPQHFSNPPLESALAIGATNATNIRAWYRTGGTGHFELRWGLEDSSQCDGKLAVTVSDDLADYTGSETLEPLQASQRYWLHLCDEQGQVLAQGSFRTADCDDCEPEKFTLALISCHQPFENNGDIRSSSQDMLTAMHKVLEQHQVDQVIMGGDQMYSDMPGTMSLFDDDYFKTVAPEGKQTILQCSAEEVRQLFHQRYRHFWNVPGWKKLLANYACYPAIDDHDIIDNWGSAIEHQQPQWQNFRQGAFQAFVDYQGSLIHHPSQVPPPSFDFASEFGSIGTYFLDIRSNRRVGDSPRIVSSQQLEDLKQYLANNGDKEFLFLVLSVPLVHLPKPLTRLAARITPEGEDFSDRWSTRGHRHDRDLIASMLHQHQRDYPEQKMVLLSGDIHIGCVHSISWEDQPSNLYQFISSGITHDTGKVIQFLSSLIIRTKRTLHVKTGPHAKVRLLPGIDDNKSNPCGDMNMGIVEITRNKETGAPQLQFMLYSNEHGEPVCKFRSEFL